MVQENKEKFIDKIGLASLLNLDEIVARDKVRKEQNDKSNNKKTSK